VLITTGTGGSDPENSLSRSLSVSQKFLKHSQEKHSLPVLQEMLLMSMKKR